MKHIMKKVKEIDYMAKEKQGILGKTIKVIMVIIFTIIGALVLTSGAIHFSQEPVPSKNWADICSMVYGSLLLTSPFFLNKNREGIFKIVKWVMVVVFTTIGALVLVSGAVHFSKEPVPSKNWADICYMVYGSLLLTAPTFLKK